MLHYHTLTIPSLVAAFTRWTSAQTPQTAVDLAAAQLPLFIGKSLVSISLQTNPPVLGRSGEQPGAGRLGKLVFTRPIAVRGVSYGQLQVEIFEPRATAAVLMTLLDTVAIQFALYAEHHALIQARTRLKVALATEKLVARASGIVAAEQAVPVSKARQWLQTEASRLGRPLRWVADLLVAHHVAFERRPGIAAGTRNPGQKSETALA